ncbi:MAG: hypothetical protein M3Y53_12530 [Thermoproteota archaeon]|jgi:hypothetical protein|nr:hypothetical protein [Thermoproteota archaeon]
MVLKLNKVQKIILVSLVLTSAVSWLLLSRQSYADNNNVILVKGPLIHTVSEAYINLIINGYDL